MVLSTYFRRYPLSWLYLPGRLLKKKTSPEAAARGDSRDGIVSRYVPYLPPSFLSSTIKFLEDKDKLRYLLQLLYSPKDSHDTSEDRCVYQRQFERYSEIKESVEKCSRHHEEIAAAHVAKAIKNLPSDLYEEATQSEPQPLPDELKFHEMYRKQLFDNELSSYEMKKLQTFQNLMHVRFPHTNAKREQPHLFWIKENLAMSRQKQAKERSLALRKKK
ncbi:hypothetical protein IE077_003461 [Cardiosporidium cionae]|uniref:Uncharacterized protein n=1 Tax=Cardiosporidium cionae TaxID=476202 RepID=A0ABQ7JF30_9APIC|nr:hypothetical protein IE077_003461 [Cardiosporidium cionae]|eukprot:KAF8822559.1 hypothetical protein IE077_003461 [Cardiosporidium cionae]